MSKVIANDKEVLAKFSYSELVTNHNVFSESCLDLELNEEKMLFMAMSYFHKVKIFNKKETISSDDWIAIHALDFGCQLEGIDLSSNECDSKLIAKAENTGRMALKRIGINNDDIFKKLIKVKKIENGKEKYLTHPIITGIEYTPADKLLKVRFAPEIYKYFSDLKGNYNSFYLNNITKMNKTKYGSKLYRLLNAKLFQFDIAEQAQVDVSIEDLRFALVCENKLKNNQNFKANAIKPAVDEINLKTNFSVKYEPIIKSNKTIGFRFIYSIKDSNKIIDRIKQLQKMEKECDKKGIPFFIDGSHFKTKNRINEMKILSSVNEKQANFLLSVNEFIQDYAGFFQYMDDTFTVKKKLKHKLLNEYDSFKDYPIDFEFYKWLKENDKYGLSTETLNKYLQSQKEAVKEIPISKNEESQFAVVDQVKDV